MSNLDCIEETSANTSPVELMPFGFHSKTNYDANDALVQTRSESFSNKLEVKVEDIWTRQPPDFRPQKFSPQPPKRNTRESQKPWLYGTIPGRREIIKRQRSVVLPHLLVSKSEDVKRFDTYFRIDRPFTAKKKFVREGMNEKGHFEDLKKHDFRGYPPLKTLGLSEFVYQSEKDPCNIKFHTERLNIIHGDRVNKATDRDIRGIQMAPPKSPPPVHECHLHFDKGPYPVKNAQFTRFRIRNRPAHSAFMERASQILEAKWAKEKYDKVLESQNKASLIKHKVATWP